MLTNKIINLTPHKINIIIGDKNIDIEPSGIVLRVIETVQQVGEVQTDFGSIPIKQKQFQLPILINSIGEEISIPQFINKECLFIVSAIGYMAIQKYYPLFVQFFVMTGDPVRDDKGNIVGCQSFSIQ